MLETGVETMVGKWQAEPIAVSGPTIFAIAVLPADFVPRWVSRETSLNQQHCDDLMDYRNTDGCST